MVCCDQLPKRSFFSQAIEIAMNDLTTRRLDIDALRALRAIRQHGGVTRAGEALGLTQSAVSHKIKRLETSLDCDLLNRRSGGPDVHGCGGGTARLRRPDLGAP
jgi:molybdenum-dependent DNA-binding transcriptional regulator ModE